MRQVCGLFVVGAVLGSLGLGGCAKRGVSREQLDALSAELRADDGTIQELEERIRKIEESPSQLHHRYLEDLREKMEHIESEGGRGARQMAEGTISLIDCDIPGCGVKPDNTVGGTQVGDVRTRADHDASPKKWTEDWYVIEPFYRYDPRRPGWKGTYIYNYRKDEPFELSSGTVKHGQEVFVYAQVPDPSSYSPTPSGVPRYRYDVRNFSNGKASAVRGALYREIINDNGVETWVDHWVLYDSYREPDIGVDTLIVNRSVPEGNGLPDFLGAYYGNPNSSICGAECTYATMIYTWQ